MWAPAPRRRRRRPCCGWRQPVVVAAPSAGRAAWRIRPPAAAHCAGGAQVPEALARRAGAPGRRTPRRGARSSSGSAIGQLGNQRGSRPAQRRVAELDHHVAQRHAGSARRWRSSCAAGAGRSAPGGRVELADPVAHEHLAGVATIRCSSYSSWKCQRTSGFGKPCSRQRTKPVSAGAARSQAGHYEPTSCSSSAGAGGSISTRLCCRRRSGAVRRLRNPPRGLGVRKAATQRASPARARTAPCRPRMPPPGRPPRRWRAAAGSIAWSW